MTRARLRKVLDAAGIRLGRKDEGDRATIFDYVDSWGIMPGIPGTGNDIPDIQRALQAAGIDYLIANIILVTK